jgi:hypothetical protein
VLDKIHARILCGRVFNRLLKQKKCKTCGWNHYTGRHCDDKKCNGKLRDTIVNFGDDLHSSIVEDQAKKDDSVEVSLRKGYNSYNERKTCCLWEKKDVSKKKTVPLLLKKIRTHYTEIDLLLHILAI